jgi:hypothetical protein
MSKITITNEKDVTPKDIVDEACVMWKKIYSAIKSDPRGWENDNGETIMKNIRSEHREFSTSYPIVVRYMCQMGQFDKHAFELWIRKIQMHPWKSESEYVEAHADYIRRLYIAKNPRASKKEIDNVKLNAYNLLTQEHDLFKTKANELEKKVTENEKFLSECNNDELYYFMKDVGHTLTNDPVFRCEYQGPIAEKYDISEYLAETDINRDGLRADELLS